MRRWLVAIASTAALWTMLAAGLGPYLIEKGYLGESAVSAVNRFFEGKQASVPLTAYVDAMNRGFHGGLMLILAGGLALAAVAADQRSPKPVSSRLVGTCTPDTLGRIRALVCGVALIFLLQEDPASTAHLPRSLADPHGRGLMELLGLIPGWDQLLASSVALTLVYYSTVVFLILAMIGTATRLVLLPAFCGYLILGGVLRMYTHFFHTGLLAVYLLALLCVLPCADGFTVDRWRHRRRGGSDAPSDPSLRYGWARYACWVVVALTYFAAGVSKLLNGGWFWWEASNIRTKILTSALARADTNEPIGVVVQSLPDAAFAALGLATLVLELGMLLVLVSRRARMVLPLLIAAMHAGIFVLQKIPFPDLILLQLVFLDPDRRAAPFRPRVDPAPRWLPAGVMALIIGYAFVAFYQIESYPISAWQMYSNSVPTIHYFKGHQLDASGRRAPIPFATIAGALRDNRERDVMKLAFDDERRHSVDEFLRMSARLQNAGLDSDERIVRYEIQRWRAEPSGFRNYRRLASTKKSYSFIVAR